MWSTNIWKLFKQRKQCFLQFSGDYCFHNSKLRLKPLGDNSLLNNLTFGKIILEVFIIYEMWRGSMKRGSCIYKYIFYAPEFSCCAGR